MGDCLLNYAIHDFLVWQRTDSNPADINRFQSCTCPNKLKLYLCNISAISLILGKMRKVSGKVIKWVNVIKLV